MASLGSQTMAIKPPRDRGGRQYTQKTITGNAVDSGAGVVLAAKKDADHTTVIDKLSYICAAAETVTIKWVDSSDDGTIVDAMPVAANSLISLEDLHANRANADIKLYTTSASSVTAFIHYHYEGDAT
jgi:hypothetical protein